MKSKGNSKYLYWMFVSIIVISLFSWIGSIYELPIRNLLTTDGLRWYLKNSIPYFSNTPIAHILILLFGIGVFYHSRLIQTCIEAFRLSISSPHRHAFSLRQKHAIALSVFVFFLYAVILLFLTSSPWAILLDITGQLRYSPFLDGFPLLFSFGLFLIGWIYGRTSGTFKNTADVQQALISSISSLAPAFIWMFFFCQVFALIDYALLSDLLLINKGERARWYIEYVVYYWPFCYYGYVNIKNSFKQ